MEVDVARKTAETDRLRLEKAALVAAVDARETAKKAREAAQVLEEKKAALFNALQKKK